MKYHKALLILLLFVLISPFVYAHTPLTPNGENNSIGTALEILNPTKSWTLYRELHGEEEVEYFKLHLRKGDKFQFSVSTPRGEDPNFVPSAVVMWPNLDKIDDVPAFVEVPTVYGSTMIAGSRPSTPEYEPFTPTSYYFVIEYAERIEEEGDYYLAVYGSHSSGRYGLAIGYLEEFTAVEWLKIPIDLIGIHVWEGQSLLMILLPLLITLIVGFPLIHVIYKLPLGSVTSIGLLAGLLDIGSGLITLVQMFIAINGATQTGSYPLTLLFALIPIVLGALIVFKVLQHKTSWTILDRATLIILGVFGLFFWAGLIIGPILTIVLGLSSLWKSLRQGT